MNITLIGMPSSGKSTIGIVLAKRLGYSYIDADLLIQEQEKRLLKTIIAQEGIDGFMQIESQVNCNIEAKNTIISPGGSVIYAPKAMQHFKDIGIILYLKVSFEEIAKRIGNPKERGVVLKEGMTIKDLYDERTVLYEKYADIIIDENNLSISEILEKICAELNCKYKISQEYLI